MKPCLLNRRTLIATAIGLPLLSAHAQVIDLGDAINKAGRQRMLSQRMSKAWLALLQDVQTSKARQVLDKSMALFDRQLVELKTYAPTAQIKTTYLQLESGWSDLSGRARISWTKEVAMAGARLGARRAV